MELTNKKNSTKKLLRIRKVFGEDATMRQITEVITIKNENPQNK